MSAAKAFFIAGTIPFAFLGLAHLTLTLRLRARIGHRRPAASEHHRRLTYTLIALRFWFLPAAATAAIGLACFVAVAFS